MTRMGQSRNVVYAGCCGEGVDWEDLGLDEIILKCILRSRMEGRGVD